MTVKHRERTLACLLASRDPADRTRAEERLHQLEPNADAVLLHGAQHLENSLNSVKTSDSMVTCLCVAVVLGCFGPFLLGNHWSGIYVSLSFLFTQVLRCFFHPFEDRHRHQLRSVILELARRDHPRGLALLLKQWAPKWESKRPAEKGRPLTQELDRLLTEYAESRQVITLLPEWLAPAHDEVAQLYRKQEHGRAILSRRDFSDGTADVLIGLIRVFARSPRTKDQVLLERIARSQVARPNQELVRDAALACLEATGNAKIAPQTTISETLPAQVTIVGQRQT